MWNTPTKSQLAQVPKLYSNEEQDIPLADTKIYLHFFIGGCDWYVAEYDGEDLFWCYADLNDPQNAEWGYTSFAELKAFRKQGVEVDCDRHWRVKPAKEIAGLKLY